LFVPALAAGFLFELAAFVTVAISDESEEIGRG
jgi:hypothetical protein